MNHSNLISKDILDLGNLFQDILNSLESGHSCSLVWTIDEQKKPLLSELITILTQDGRPGCNLLVFHPYFMLTSKPAEHTFMVQFWQMEENKKQILEYFKTEEYERWNSTLNNSLRDYIEGEEFLLYLAEVMVHDYFQLCLIPFITPSH
jgi:hypothetical protein